MLVSPRSPECVDCTETAPRITLKGEYSTMFTKIWTKAAGLLIGLGFCGLVVLSGNTPPRLDPCGDVPPPPGLTCPGNPTPTPKP